MNAELWGLVMMGVGLFFLICGWLKSDFLIYRIFVARSRLVWGDRVHTFFVSVGVVIILIGTLMAFGRI
jgi:uncharacterized membrane protein